VRPELPRELSRALEHAMHPNPERRPTAAGLRDMLLAAVAGPAVAAAPGWAPEAAPAPARTRALPQVMRSHVHAAAGAIAMGSAAAWTLTAFPMYPPAWTLPIAAVLAAIAWRRPGTAAAAGAVLAVPAFWNFAQAAGLLWIALAGAWTWTTRHTDGGRERCLAPLWAGPLALVGLGPAFVMVAATAPTRARRAAEAAAGSVVAAICGGWAAPAVTHALAGANSPFVYARVVARDPALLLTGCALVFFAVLLAPAWRAQRQVQALTLWGLAFALAVAGIPQLLHSGSGGVAAGVAAALTAIIPVCWAVAGPDRKRGS